MTPPDPLGQHGGFLDDGGVFMGARRDPAGCSVALFGVAYDGTTSFRPGTRFGPAAIRAVSEGLETYDPQLDCDLADVAYADLGAVDCPHGAPEPVVEAVRRATEAVLDQNLRPLMLGGEHSISSGAVAAVAARHPDLVLLQLDAHADLRDSWLGSRHSHACAMRRCLEVLPSGTLLQLAIRSGTRDEFAELRHERRLLTLDQLLAVPIVARGWDAARARFPDIAPRRLAHELVRSQIGTMVNDLIEETRRRISASGVATVDDVRAAGQALCGFSPAMREEERDLKRFMYANLYHHPRQLAAADAAHGIVRGLFAAYRDDPATMSPEWAADVPAEEPARSRHIADFIAGMTDRYAIARYRELVGDIDLPEGF